jgi:nucleotide-binding universal stress UspA family protein
LPYARGLAQLYGSTVHILHVAGSEPMLGPMGVVYDDLEIQGEPAHQKIAAVKEWLPGVVCRELIEKGPVADAVCRVVAERSIDLIVVGTHGRHALKHIFLGSVAEQIFRRATCPVLTVGPAVRNGLAKGKLGNMLLATDFSPASLHALEFIASLASSKPSSLTLFHAIEPCTEGLVECFPSHAGEIRERLSELVAEYPTIHCSVVVKYGWAADTIVKTAIDTDADMIVMGVHRGGSVASHAPGAVAHQVVSRAFCPVLTVRG